MRFFIDTANVEDIRKANDMGVICGVTTNPSLIAKEGRDFNEVIKAQSPDSNTETSCSLSQAKRNSINENG